MAQADPLLTSWFTARSSTYARIVETDTELAAGTSKTTWTRTSGPNTLSIIGWMLDGLPVYGPYGYSTALDATSGVRHMTGGFVLRNGAVTGVDNINTAGRTLPAWTLRNNGNTASAGPAVSTTYPLGRYIEDWAYLGDLVKTGTAKYTQGTDFDLNEYNVRYAVTPEFPNGTWAYFLNITAVGTPQFPYMINRWFHGTPTGGAVVTVAETVTNVFKGGASLTEASSATLTGNQVQLTWTSVEGGTYKIEATENLSAWSTLTETQNAATAPTTSYTETSGAAHDRRFYRITRTATAAYDDNSGTTTTPTTQGISTIAPATGTRGTNVSVQITLNSAHTTAPPPNTVAPTSVTLTRTGTATLTGTALSGNSGTGVVSTTFAIPAGATAGAYTVSATFGPNLAAHTTPRRSGGPPTMTGFLRHSGVSRCSTEA